MYLESTDCNTTDFDETESSIKRLRRCFGLEFAGKKYNWATSSLRRRPSGNFTNPFEWGGALNFLCCDNCVGFDYALTATAYYLQRETGQRIML